MEGDYSAETQLATFQLFIDSDDGCCVLSYTTNSLPSIPDKVLTQIALLIRSYSLIYQRGLGALDGGCGVAI